MVNRDLIPNLKSSCISIGIKEENDSEPIVIGGSGFFIDPTGFFITATHVVDGLKKTIKELEDNGSKNLKLAVFVTQNTEDKVQIFPFNVGYVGAMEIKPPGEYLGPKEYDLALGKIIGSDLNVPFLKIKSPCKLELFTEILMCGYPGGEFSFNINLKKDAIKTSPLLQIGRISGLMTADNTVQPTGIITDIIGTGGSSGSPIVESNDGEVIGVAQNVIPGGVYSLPEENKKPKGIGSAVIGLTFGVSNYLLNPAVTATLEQIKKILDKKGNLKSNVREIDGIIDEHGLLDTSQKSGIKD